MDAHETALSLDNARLRAEIDRLGAELRTALADAMMAWEQAGADRVAYNTTLNELDAAQADAAALREALWVPQDEKGTLYCCLCENRYPEHYETCIASLSHPGAVLLTELEALREYRAYWEPYIKKLGDEHTRQGGELAAARAVLVELHVMADAPGEDIRAAIDKYFAFAKEQKHAT